MDAVDTYSSTDGYTFVRFYKDGSNWIDVKNNEHKTVAEIPENFCILYFDPDQEIDTTSYEYSFGASDDDLPF